MAQISEAEPHIAAALEAVQTFLSIAREHVDDDSLAIVLVSAGATLMKSSRGVEPAVDALRQAIDQLRWGT